MTRANIAVVIDGKVYAAYLNHDGYPPYIGPRLMNGYLNPKDPETNLRKIKTLCTNGEIYPRLIKKLYVFTKSLK